MQLWLVIRRATTAAEAKKAITGVKLRLIAYTDEDKDLKEEKCSHRSCWSTQQEPWTLVPDARLHSQQPTYNQINDSNYLQQLLSLPHMVSAADHQNFGWW